MRKRAPSLRDPRSFRELRRLARAAHRSPEALAVLHDALLESLPSYAEAIAEADRRSRDDEGGAWNVWFLPLRLNPTTRKHGTTALAFEVHRAFVDHTHLRRPETRGAIVVYETTPTNDLVYDDPEGRGAGVVVDRRTGVVMGIRYAGGGWSHIQRRQNIGALNTAFLRWMRWRLAHRYSRRALIDWLAWVDWNGAYTDEAARREGQPPLTHEEAADLVFEHVAETKETPEEMRRASSRRRRDEPVDPRRRRGSGR